MPQKTQQHRCTAVLPITQPACCGGYRMCTVPMHPCAKRLKAAGVLASRLYASEKSLLGNITFAKSFTLALFPLAQSKTSSPLLEPIDPALSALITHHVSRQTNSILR
eukprot:GFKZ01003707.1.p2 GENE.GFKZ01003707.1~~GFKZ01003707.1.p2  ORF type:complete len:108 (-),score=4.75 GFKZ01003707.1:94-417(-)